MTPAPNRTNNPFHALENDDEDDRPGGTTWLPPPLPASVPQTPVQCAQVAPFQQAMPMRLVFDNVTSPSVPSTTPKPSQPPLPRVSKTQSPIAHRKRSRLVPPWQSSLMELVQYHIPTAKTTWPQSTLASQSTSLYQALALSEPETTEFACLCTRLSTLNKGHSIAVLDQESDQLLEHCQLWRDPRYKEVWDRLYSNELGCLCQGIGTGNKTSGKQVAGTNTFHLIPYSDIPHHKHKEIIYMKVVCEIQEGKDDKNLTRITVGETWFFIKAMQAPTRHC
jgi:hypothetical protein